MISLLLALLLLFELLLQLLHWLLLILLLYLLVLLFVDIGGHLMKARLFRQRVDAEAFVPQGCSRCLTYVCRGGDRWNSTLRQELCCGASPLNEV